MKDNKTDMEKIKDIILEEYKKGNVTVSGFEGLQKMPIADIIKQPADGLLYDLNRNEAVILTFLPDPKWVNDYASSQVIRELKKQLDEAQSRANDIAGEKWIDVNERLPELDTNVLAWGDSDLRVMCLSKLKIDGEGHIVWCDCGDNINGYGHFDDNYNVTHWQSLPTPPQSLNKNNQ